MITPSFNITATERVLPKLALDFTTANLDPRVTFTRSGATATCVNSNGYVAVVAANIPRFDYDPITKICKGLLIEEARTNLFTYSEDLTQAIWLKTNCTISSNAIVSPSNVQNADGLVETTTNGIHFLTYSYSSYSPSTAYSFSFYAKAGARRYVYSRGSGVTGFQDQGAVFDLQDGVIVKTTASVTASSITPMGNGWFRCAYTSSMSTGTSADRYIFAANDTTAAAGTNPTNYAGNGTTVGVYVWGVQTEAGAFPTSYIPTVASQVTRTADVATMTGTNFSDWYNQSQGAVETQWTQFGTTNTCALSLTDDLSSLATAVQYYLQARAADNQIRFWQSTSGGGLDTPVVLQAGVKQGTAVFSYVNATSAKGAANGNATVTTASAPQSLTAIAMTIGYSSGSVGFLNGHIQKIMYWVQNLTSPEVQAFSK